MQLYLIWDLWPLRAECTWGFPLLCEQGVGSSQREDQVPLWQRGALLKDRCVYVKTWWQGLSPSLSPVLQSNAISFHLHYQERLAATMSRVWSRWSNWHGSIQVLSWEVFNLCITLSLCFPLGFFPVSNLTTAYSFAPVKMSTHMANTLLPFLCSLCFKGTVPSEKKNPIIVCLVYIELIQSLQ